MTHESWQQEQFSLAYVRAVAATAGFAASKLNKAGRLSRTERYVTALGLGIGLVLGLG